MLEALREAAENPKREILKWREATGRPVVALLPAYFPEPVAHAAGALPVGMWGNTLPLGVSDSYLQSFSCTIARSIMELALRPDADFVDAYVFTSMCDNFETLAEIFKLALPHKRAYTFVIPNTSHMASRVPHLEAQLGASLRFLEGVTGVKPSPDDYAQSYSIYREFANLVGEFYQHRQNHPGALSNYDFFAVLKASFFMPKEDYNKMLRKLLETLGDQAGEGPRVLVSGIVPQPLPLMRVFDQVGMNVVADDFAGAYRLFSKSPPAALTAEELDRFLLSGAPCSTLHREGEGRGKYLATRVQETRARGLVNWHIKFCEPESFDRPQLLEELRQEGVSTTVIEVETSARNFDPIRTRLEAFAEVMAQGGENSR